MRIKGDSLLDKQDERIEVPGVSLGSISFLGFGLWLRVVFARAGSTSWVPSPGVSC